MTNKDDGITIESDEFEMAGWWGICTSKHEGGTTHMTMYFQNAVIAQKFIDFCKRRAIHGRTKLEGHRYVITADVPKHDHLNFIAQWAGMTMEGAPKQAYRGGSSKPMNDESPMPFGKYGPNGKDPRPLGKVPASYLLWLWEGNGGPELWKEADGLSNYIRTNFHVIELDAPDVIVTNRPDVPRRTP